MTERITSRKNPLLVHIKKLLADGGYRRACGQCAGDGVKLLAEAARWDAGLETVVAAEGVELPPLPAGVRLVEVPGDVMASLSPMKTPQGALFVCRRGAQPLPGLTGRQYLVLDGVQDPGNVGTVWRTADAMGVDGLILLHHCADPWGPKTIRATMGAAFRLPAWEAEEEELAAALKSAGLPLYAAALGEGAVEPGGADLSRCAVAVGSEGRGVSPWTLEHSALRLRIPMEARCESLNAAAAAAILLWEMRKHRG